MAELAISAALALFETGPHILDQLNLHAEVHDEIQHVKKWLTFIQAFISENYGRRGRNEMLLLQKDLVVKVRTIANDIEDVMEEFVLHSPPCALHFHSHTINLKLHKLAHNMRHTLPLREILVKTASIERDIKDFVKQQGCVRTHHNRQGSSNGLRANSLLLVHEMIGYEKPREEFTDRLADWENGLVRLSVAGPAGSGKTTFVKSVYSTPGIKEHFDCHAWVYVSRNSNPADLFTNMLKQFCSSSHEPYPADDGLNAMKRLHGFLRGKRYILVLVEVCRKEDWDDIKDALPDTDCGSRVVVVTCSSDVASICASSDEHVYKLNGLEWEQGWELFCMNAFPDIDGECPSELKEHSTRILERCEGLPLAILAISRALADKPRLPDVWSDFHDTFRGTEITNSLLPGYLDLSSSLKSCLLHFSIFPEGHCVNRGRLIRLWVAEGFAYGTDNQTAEEVAKDYLNKLIIMNFVHVSEWDFDGSPRSCRVLNLVHDFIMEKCKDEKFASVFGLFPMEHTSQNLRRMSVQKDLTKLPQTSNYGGVRSMFLSELPETSPLDLKGLLRKLKLVRVLDFQGAPLTDFPRDIKRLFILKYLDLSSTKIKTIPRSIKKLLYLETLDLKQTDVTQLPKEISLLPNLRHLLAYKYNTLKNHRLFDSVQSVEMSAGISNLVNLQKLSLVKVDEKCQILSDLKNMTQLRKLGLTGLKKEHGEKLRSSVGKMKILVTLDLRSTNKQEYLPLGDMSYLPSDTLQRLYLKGRLKELPAYISSLHNLIRISLKWSKMESSPLRGLQCLPNLIELQLVDCYVGIELIFEDKCFRKLRILVIEELPKLLTIAIGQGAMPELKTMSLRRCPKLMVCPLGMHKLTKVEVFSLYDMPEALTSRLRKNKEDHAMIKHIPVVRSITNNNHSWAKEILSFSRTEADPNE